MPLDLGFSPWESILLYDAMVHLWPEWPRMQVCVIDIFYGYDSPSEISILMNGISSGLDKNSIISLLRV